MIFTARRVCIARTILWRRCLSVCLSVTCRCSVETAKHILKFFLPYGTELLRHKTPLYLTCLLDDYVPGRSLRSSQSNLLTVPSYRLNFGARSFRVAAPTVWNSLPADIQVCSLHGTFTCHLKLFILMLFLTSATY